MGFGGINTHIVVGPGPSASVNCHLSPSTLHCRQDAELLLLSASSSKGLLELVEELLQLSKRISFAELTDLAADLSTRVSAVATVRASLVASDPDSLTCGLETLRAALLAGSDKILDAAGQVSLAQGEAVPLVLLFGGQGNALESFAPWCRFLLPDQATSRVLGQTESSETEFLQPAVVAQHVAAVALLERLGVKAAAALGHSLGEISAYHWSGALSDQDAIELATVRGKAMSECPGHGSMASLDLSKSDAASMIAGLDLSVACHNGPNLTVVSGSSKAVEELQSRARHAGVGTYLLEVSHAFHSTLMAPAVPALASFLAGIGIRPLEHKVYSSITGSGLDRHEDIRDLLLRQLQEPVLFMEALNSISADNNGDAILLDVGTGPHMAALAASQYCGTTYSFQFGSKSVVPFLKALGAAFISGNWATPSDLFRGRSFRPFNYEEWNPHFLVNPCETEADSMPFLPSMMSLHQTEKQHNTTVESPGRQQESILDSLISHVRSIKELPNLVVSKEARLLRDLGLNSMMVSTLTARVAQEYQLRMPETPISVNLTIAELSELLEAGGAEEIGTPGDNYPGLGTWARGFRVEEEQFHPGKPRSGVGAWEVHSIGAPSIAEVAENRLSSFEGTGIVICLQSSGSLSADQVDELLRLLKQAADCNATRLGVVQCNSSVDALIKCWQLEHPLCVVVIVSVQSEDREGWGRAAELIAASDTFLSCTVSNSGTVRREQLHTIQQASIEPTQLYNHGDLVLITGGAKGIGAEVALWLGTTWGVKLAVTGRSSPAATEAAGNLARLRAAGIEVKYYTSDVSSAGDCEELRNQLLQDFEKAPVAIFHCAAINNPRRVDSIGFRDIDEARQPKVRGAQNLVATFGDTLSQFIAFGSIIGRSGWHGEAAYAMANEDLRLYLTNTQPDYPQCSFLCLEWSVWAEQGMGTKLGVLESMRRAGVHPLAVVDALQMLHAAIQWRVSGDIPVSIVLAGRLPRLATLPIHSPLQPARRFLQRRLSETPGVELVAECDLSLAADHYLRDHFIDGKPVFPAVAGLEAAAEAAQSVLNSLSVPRISDAQFMLPLSLPCESALTLRIVALALTATRVLVAIRSSETNYSLDHFAATCDFEFEPSDSPILEQPAPPADSEYLYRASFHGPGYQLVTRYESLTHQHCVATLKQSVTCQFASLLPPETVLGSIFLNDAIIHALQSCIPLTRVIPVSVDKWTTIPTSRPPSRVIARQTADDGQHISFDIDALDEFHVVAVSVRGLTLRRLAPILDHPLPQSILQVAIARLVDEVIATREHLRVTFGLEDPDNLHGQFAHTPNGKPYIANGEAVSRSHFQGLTLTVHGTYGPLACDIEGIVERPAEMWSQLLGKTSSLLAELTQLELCEDFNVSATRAWGIKECLVKAGIQDAPLTFIAAPHPRVAVFGTTSVIIVSLALNVQQTGWVCCSILGPRALSQDTGCFRNTYVPHALTSTTVQRPHT
jgi:enediyne polyketide synthase